MNTLVIVGAYLVLSVSAEFHCACPDDYRPVCGSDGKTYPNVCEFNCYQRVNKGMSIVKEGECESQKVKRSSQQEFHCACPDDYNPVCGSDGKTYPNVCEFNCYQRVNNGLYIVKEGECESHKVKRSSQQEFHCACPDDYRPVCGSDSKTYPNVCEFNCYQRVNKGLTIVKEGECESKKVKRSSQKGCLEVDVYAPVCASNGVTYKNTYQLECFMRDHPDVKPSYYGKCKTQEYINAKVFGCRCPVSQYAPVCGTNGDTYDNMCIFQCESSDNPTLGMAHAGPC